MIALNFFFFGLFASNWHKNDTRVTARHKSIFKADNRHVKMIDEGSTVFETLYNFFQRQKTVFSKN